MANISLVYDGLITLIEAALPAYKRLSDAYEAEDNDWLRIVKGYSLGFTEGTNTNREICPDVSIARGFTFTLTNLYAANDADPVARSAVEKSLLEDAALVWKQVELTDELNGVQTPNATYVSDGGIEYINDKKAISITSAITVEYYE